MFLTRLRHRLPTLTTVWLLCQALSLSALAPRYCCAAHSHDGASHSAADGAAAAGVVADCHQTAEADACPMTHAPGDACPMHGGAADADSDRHATADDDCVMRGTCQGPMTALASLIWIPGVLGETPAAAPDRVAPLAFTAADTAASRIPPVDLPPPRG